MGGETYVGIDGRCVYGSYPTTHAPEPLVCSPWTTCNPGERVTRTGSADEDRLCIPCEPGTFSATENASSCQPIQPCNFGEKLTSPGSSTKDAQCEATSAFNPIVLEPLSEIFDFIATNHGTYTLIGYQTGTNLRIVHHGTTGERLPDIDLESLEYVRIASIDSSLFAVGLGLSENSTLLLVVRRYDKDGSLIWEKRFDDILSDLSVSSDGTDLYVAGVARLPSGTECDETVEPPYCWETYSTAMLVLRLNADGKILLEQADPKPENTRLVDMEVSSSGHVFLSGSASDPASPPIGFATELDATFQEVHSHSLASLKYNEAPSLASDGSGEVWTFGRHAFEENMVVADYSVSHLAPGGEVKTQIPIDVRGDRLDVFAAAPRALHFGGSAFPSGKLMFLTLATDGTVTSQGIHESRVPETIEAIAVTPEGVAYAAGKLGRGNEESLFVTPWPP